MEIEQAGSFNDNPSLDPQKAIYSKKDENPRVQYMKGLLKNVGITSYEDDVIPMLIEFKNEYTNRLLSEAKNYAEHARLSQISDRCIIEAEESLNRSNFSTKRFYLNLATPSTSETLRKDENGVVLPHQSQLLSTSTYDVAPVKN